MIPGTNKKRERESLGFNESLQRIKSRRSIKSMLTYLCVYHLYYSSLSAVVGRDDTSNGLKIHSKGTTVQHYKFLNWKMLESHTVFSSLVGFFLLISGRGYLFLPLFISTSLNNLASLSRRKMSFNGWGVCLH